MNQGVLTIIAVVWLSGCSLLAHNESDEGNKKFYGFQINPAEMAARDIVGAILQANEVSSQSGVIEISISSTNYGNYLTAKLSEFGYTVRRVARETGNNRLRYTEAHYVAGAKKAHRYSVTINGVTAERVYEERLSGLFPRSKMKISGTKSEIVIDDSEFQEQDKNQIFPTGVEYVDDGGGLLVNTIPHWQTPNVERVQVSATLRKKTDMKIKSKPVRQISYSELVGEPEDLENMYVRGGSNFEPILAGMTQKSSDVVIFANDSLILGPKGKKRISTIMQKYSENDVVRLIGCSHGNTAIDNGNEVLALARVKRVREEVVAYGIDREKILAEGCWAPVHFDEVMPRRGVVVHLFKKS